MTSTLLTRSTTRLQKQNALQALLRLRGRLVLNCPFDCARSGLGAMLTPVSISAFPVRGYSIAEDVVGVNSFMQSPLVVAGRPFKPLG
ncbi:MAG: hypothetical protein V3W05_02250, partial [candidate division NC10 bacterium]